MHPATNNRPSHHVLDIRAVADGRQPRYGITSTGAGNELRMSKETKLRLEQFLAGLLADSWREKVSHPASITGKIEIAICERVAPKKPGPGRPKINRFYDTAVAANQIAGNRDPETYAKRE